MVCTQMYTKECVEPLNSYICRIAGIVLRVMIVANADAVAWVMKNISQVPEGLAYSYSGCYQLLFWLSP